MASSVPSRRYRQRTPQQLGGVGLARVLTNAMPVTRHLGEVLSFCQDLHPDPFACRLGRLDHVAGVVQPDAVATCVLEHVSWRAVFFINLPIALVVILISLRHVAENTDRESSRVDWLGAIWQHSVWARWFTD